MIGGARPTTENHDTQLAYAAGLFDAKGGFIVDEHSGISLHIADEHYEAIIRVIFALGGGKYWHSHSGGHAMHHVEISDSLEVLEALEDMLPYLRDDRHRKNLHASLPRGHDRLASPGG